MFSLARNCSQLENLNVQGCRNIQDDGMAALTEGCQNIRYLCISNCPHLTDQSLVCYSTQGVPNNIICLFCDTAK